MYSQTEPFSIIGQVSNPRVDMWYAGVIVDALGNLRLIFEGGQSYIEATSDSLTWVNGPI